jgi:predicted glycosyl hydrolase (DUF1957 family)
LSFFWQRSFKSTSASQYAQSNTRLHNQKTAKITDDQMVEAKKNERTNALKEVKRLCKEFGFTAGMLKGSLAEGRKAKP